MHIRNATPDDFDAMLALNEESVAFLSPLDRARLQKLSAEAALHRVVEQDAEVAAFLLCFREGATYDSPNYRWFVERYERFLYIDRVVVSRQQQGRGLGSVLYRDAIAFAERTAAPLLVCEFDIDPPNEGSRIFHQRFGFHEVGTQTVANGSKRVSLQALTIGAAS